MTAILTGIPSTAGGDQLLERHLEAAVAIDGEDGLIGHGHLGADRGRDRIAHRAETTRVDPGAGSFESPELRRPHLVLADTGDDDGVAAGEAVQLLDDVLLLDRALGVLVVVQRDAPPASRASVSNHSVRIRRRGPFELRLHRRR